MPELPEVETVRLQLNKILPGKTIQEIEILNNRSFIGNSRFLSRKKIRSVKRLAKMLIVDLGEESILAIHLKMTGQLIYNGEKNKHTRVILTFSHGDKLYFNDQRKFGWMKVVNSLDMLQNNLGPDALNELTLDKFKTILASSKRPVKLLLMDQTKIGGVGNIYANEALFRAKIYPRMPANKLLNGQNLPAGRQVVKLFDSLIKVLKDGIRRKGASRSHFRDIYGKKGMVQEHFSVYDREGGKCPNNCGNKIKKMRLGGRGTFLCSNCQSEDILIE